jgi:hypothetical protein
MHRAESHNKQQLLVLFLELCLACARLIQHDVQWFRECLVSQQKMPISQSVLRKVWPMYVWLEQVLQ